MSGLSPWVAWFAAGSTAALVVAQILSAPTLIVAALSVTAVLCYSVGLWQWLGQFESRSKPVGGSQQTQETLLKCLGIFLFLFFVIFATILHYRVAPPDTSETEATLSRYRRLGIESNTGTVTLIEMTDGELKKKAAQLVQNVRKLISAYEEQDRRLQSRHDKKEIDEKTLIQQYNELLGRAAKEYHNEFIQTFSLRSQNCAPEFLKRNALNFSLFQTFIPLPQETPQWVYIADLVPLDLPLLLPP
jgi:hypothetical protein